MERGTGIWPEEELARPAAVLAQRFIQRWDVHALQLKDGRYACVREQLNVDHLYAHLQGKITLGTYLLNQESKVRFIVLDNDAQDGWSYLLRCGATLARHKIPAYLEKSRRGGHFWIFFEGPLKGASARAFAQAILAEFGFGGFEIYPKQDTAGKGPGSLIRLPFGVHQLTGNRYGFYAGNGQPLGSTLREQLYALQSPEFVSEAVVASHRIITPPRVPKALPWPLQEPTHPVSERLKARVTVLEFISQYVELKPTASGAVGLCPFHDDQHPSFGVNDKENYWHCFAGCGGGSIIDFWRLWRKKQGHDPGFTQTVTELAQMLLAPKP